MKEIAINEIENIRIGNAQNYDGGTGCTVIICENGAPTGLDVRGGGPASRESELLKPVASADKIYAVLLSGGSAFGLDAAGGVMKYLEERDIGYDVGVTKVPLVCQSCIFDLTVASKDVRPDGKMAYEACIDSENNQIVQGNIGAGTGASVGKILGMDYAMKSGLGCYAVQSGELKIGAIVSVNALGDIFDYDTNEKIAGLLSEDKNGFRSSEEQLIKSSTGDENLFTANTTIGVIITNGKFNKTQMNKIASMGHNGYARTINPLHTTADGDSIYAMSVGEVEANIDAVGTLAAKVMGKAVNNAIKNTKSMYNLKAYNELLNK